MTSVSSADKFQQHGDEDALGRLVQSNLRIVVHYAKRFRRLGVPLLDLIHEGNLGLIEAARRFDPTRNTDFQPAAMWWIRQAMMHLLAETGRSAETTIAGLLAAVTQGRQIEAIRVAIEYAQSRPPGRKSGSPRRATLKILPPTSARKAVGETCARFAGNATSTPARCTLFASTACCAAI